MNEHAGPGWRIGVGNCLDGMRAMPGVEFVGLELDPEHAATAARRITEFGPLFHDQGA